MRNRRLAVLLMLFIMATMVPVMARADAAEPDCSLERSVWGVCFATLPKLVCCSGAYLGWSQVTVGDRFPITGHVRQSATAPLTTLQFRAPSGKTTELPVDGDRFSGVVSFDEEGIWNVQGVSTEDPAPPSLAYFGVAYRVVADGAPLAQALFATHLADPAQQTLTVPVGQPANLELRFTDAAGQPVVQQQLKLGRLAQPLTTDAAGRVQIAITPAGKQSGYDLLPIYPGLALLSYRTAVVDENHVLTGLPGGDIQGIQQGGDTLFPLRDFLTRADTAGFGNTPEWITWHPETRIAELGDLWLMVDTGHVLRKSSGALVGRVRPLLHDGRIHLTLPDLALILDQSQWAATTADGGLRIAVPFIP